MALRCGEAWYQHTFSGTLYIEHRRGSGGDAADCRLGSKWLTRQNPNKKARITAPMPNCFLFQKPLAFRKCEPIAFVLKDVKILNATFKS